MNTECTRLSKLHFFDDEFRQTPTVIHKLLNFLNEIIAVWTTNILFKIEQFFWYTPPTFFCDSIGILAFRRQNCSELVLNIFHLSDFFKDFDIFPDRKPHLCCQLPGFPDTEVKYQSPLKKIRKTLDWYFGLITQIWIYRLHG